MSAAKILAFIPVLLGAALVPSIARAEYSAASEADILAWGAARGGDEIRFIDNGDGSADFIHIFTSTSTVHTLVNSFPREALILAVGGGGSGGADCGGGGGAGGVVTNSVTFAPGVYSVRVGAGGIGKIHSGAVTTGESQSATLWGDNGGDTGVTNTTTGAEFLLAYGGGGGGSYAGGNGTQSSPGRAGGSGGGASGATGTTYRVPGAATQTAPGLGNAGSQGYGNNIGGGGGGALSAGASGATSTKGAAGGAGIELDITGESVVYAKGGAGGSADANVAYGGGDSSDTYGDSGNGNQAGQPGRDGTGSGGGGGGRNAYRRSGAGGSGIFVVRYTVTAAEKPRSYPFSSMTWISMEPRPTASALEAPLMPPKSMLASTFACARPPEKWPQMASQNSKIRSVMPPRDMMLAAKMKNGMQRKVNVFTPPTILEGRTVKATSLKERVSRLTPAILQPIGTPISTSTINATKTSTACIPYSTPPFPMFSNGAISPQIKPSSSMT